MSEEHLFSELVNEAQRVLKLKDEIDKLRAEKEILVRALEDIAKTDISSEAPDFLWLQRWRHNTKDKAREALASVGEKK